MGEAYKARHARLDRTVAVSRLYVPATLIYNWHNS